jgi:hypothetical protein
MSLHGIPGGGKKKIKMDYSGLQKIGAEFRFDFYQVENNQVTAVGQTVQAFRLMLYLSYWKIQDLSGIEITYFFII